MGRHDCAVSQIQSMYEPVFCFCMTGISCSMLENINITAVPSNKLPVKKVIQCNMRMGEQCVSHSVSPIQCGTLTEFFRKDEHIYARFPSPFYLAELGKNSKYSRAVCVRLVGTLQLSVYIESLYFCLFLDLRTYLDYIPKSCKKLYTVSSS